MEIKFLDKFLKKYNIDDDDINKELISLLYEYDPSPNKKYLHWLYVRFVAEFGLKNIKYFDHEYWDGVNKSLVVLEYYSDRFKNAGMSTDIYSYNDIDDFIIAAEKSFRRSEKKVTLKNDIDLVDDFNGITILYPSTSEASCYYGRGTKWCVTDEGTYDNYINEGDLFFILNKSSNKDDYKTALYINAFGVIQGFDSTDNPLNISFGDVDNIEFNEDSNSIIYPKRVGSSIKKYSETKIPNKPLKNMAKVFKDWVKSLGDSYDAGILDIEESEFYLTKNINYKNIRNVGNYKVADQEKLKELIYDANKYDIFHVSNEKRDRLVKVIGEKNILKYFNLDEIFDDMLLDDKFPFYDEYNLDDLSDDEIEKSPEIRKLKKEFKSNPVEFYNKNIYRNSIRGIPKYTNYKGLSGMLFNYDSDIRLDKLMKDYPEYCLDSKANPIFWVYEGKKYYIMNTKEDNEDIYGN